MATHTSPDTFHEVLEMLEPRAPMMTMNLQQPFGGKLKAYDCMVEVTFYDSLTCDELGRYEIDPIAALQMMHHASRFAVDGELCDEVADFRTAHYDILAAWFYHRAEQLTMLATPVEPATCSFGDVQQFMRDAYARTGGNLVVTIDGATWRTTD